MVTRGVRLAIRLSLARTLDRAVFGTPGAAYTYAEMGVGAASTRTILELPAPAPSVTDGSNRDALFVGRMEDRKGVLAVLRAWEAIEDAGGVSDVQPRITLVGDGPLAPVVRSWVTERPERRTHVSRVEHAAISSLYLRHRVLIAPSKRDGRWREQVGLPIKEALAHGLTIVTSGETGFAEWLTDNGHSVVSAEALSTALEAAIASPLNPAFVVSTLPARDGREESDRWLRSG
ncbi:hypothetical protein B1729_09945 [Microbacterium sp. B35-04]|nr:hypothetical protein B1729_09945 [Microbacterium sp. B35-04]